MIKPKAQRDNIPNKRVRYHRALVSAREAPSKIGLGPLFMYPPLDSFLSGDGAQEERDWRIWIRAEALVHLFWELRAANRSVPAIKRAMRQMLEDPEIQEITSEILVAILMQMEAVATEERMLGGRERKVSDKAILDRYNLEMSQKRYGARQRTARACGISESTLKQVIKGRAQN